MKFLKLDADPVVVLILIIHQVRTYQSLFILFRSGLITFTIMSVNRIASASQKNNEWMSFSRKKCVYSTAETELLSVCQLEDIYTVYIKLTNK